MPRLLDRARPYGEVHGGVSRTYEQDGLSFDSKGVLIGDEPAGEVMTAARFWLTPDDPEQPSEFEAMPTAALMALVDQYGGEFTTREAAVSYLKGR